MTFYSLVILVASLWYGRLLMLLLAIQADCLG